MKTSRHKKEASALILVLWAAALMTITIMGVIELVNSSLEENLSKGRQFKARLLAESGLAMGLHPEVKPDEKLLEQVLSEGPTEKFAVELTSEDGRININNLLAKMLPPNNQKEARRELLILLKGWGLESEEGSMVIDSLLDWVDADNDHHLNGAENDYYMTHGHPDFPPNRLLRSIGEMEYVKGMNIVAQKNPNWKDAFTIWGEGKVNVNHAPADLIQISASVTPYQAEAVVRYRTGPDGKQDTKDDITFTNMVDVLNIMGFPQGSESDLNRLNERLSLEDKIWRIESTGSVGDYSKKITVVADRTAIPPLFFEWQEK